MPMIVRKNNCPFLGNVQALASSAQWSRVNCQMSLFFLSLDSLKGGTPKNSLHSPQSRPVADVLLVAEKFIKEESQHEKCITVRHIYITFTYYIAFCVFG